MELYGYNEEKIAQENGWTLMAFIDESQPYEVDQTAIYASENGFILATASGCSCWAGEWDVERYEDLPSLFQAIGLHTGTARRFNPSLAGVEALRAQVEARLNA